jgi:KaiC/GvpD/RAD55 family RecA-like ATPase
MYSAIRERLKANPKFNWAQKWLTTGMLVCAEESGKIFELKNGKLPAGITALGCGGWDSDGTLRWVGLDLDVGHGAVAYDTVEQAIEDANKVRDFVGGAAEIRLSKSGKGVHVRVPVVDGIKGGVKAAAPLAKWLAHTTGIKADRSPLGRQNFWFWSKSLNDDSFLLIVDEVGKYDPPPEAFTYTDAPAAPAVIPAAQPNLHQDRADLLKRAAAYMAKVPPAVEGQGGDDATFSAATVLCKDFDLSEDEAWPIFCDWNARCSPPWDERRLRRKLHEARTKSTKQAGRLLTGEPLVKRFVSSPDEAKPEIQYRTASHEVIRNLRAQMQAEIDGTRFAAAWPWAQLTRSTNALLPGTVTVFCAPPGAAKSFFIMQCLSFWLEIGYRCKVLQLEENLEFHTRRVLAQVCGSGGITSPAWTKDQGAAAIETLDRYEKQLTRIAEAMCEPVGRFDTLAAVEWVRRAVADGNRILVIDPITARRGMEKPWIEDETFINEVREILRSADCSLILVTHPPKNAQDTTLDNISGGAAFQRFTQNVFYMCACDEEDVPILHPHDESHSATINRRIWLRKLRNGIGTGSCIGYWFDGKTLTFHERGVVKPMFAL